MRCDAPLHVGGALVFYCHLDHGHKGDHETQASPYPTRLVWASDVAEDEASTHKAEQ